MRDCPSTDAILAIGDALEWDLVEGLHHLQTCEECRAEMDVLRLTREVFREAAPVDPAVLQRIAASVRVSPSRGQRRARLGVRRTEWVDAATAGLAAPLVLMSSRVPIDDASTVLLAVALGAALMAVGRTLARPSAVAPDGTRV